MRKKCARCKGQFRSPSYTKHGGRRNDLCKRCVDQIQWSKKLK